MGKLANKLIEVGTLGLVKDPLGIRSGERAAGQAADVQEQASQDQLGEVRRQFNVTEQRLEPFRQAGVSALDQQRALLGLGAGDPNAQRRAELQSQISAFDTTNRGTLSGGGNFGPQQFPAGAQAQGAAGPTLADLQTELGALGQAPQSTAQEQQQAAFSALSQSPGQQFLRDRAQKNLLRNASAIGGLGGGNVRSALVQQGVGFAQQDLQNQFGRLGQLAGQGHTAATNVGQFGQQAAGRIGQALGAAGQARASGILGRQQVGAQATGNLLQLGGQIGGAFLGG